MVIKKIYMLGPRWCANSSLSRDTAWKQQQGMDDKL